jgi:putative serine protease PepD
MVAGDPGVINVRRKDSEAMTRPRTRTLASLAAAVAVGAGGGAAVYAAADGGGSGTATATPATATAQPAANVAKALTINQIYKQDSLGVVEITVTSTGPSNGDPFGGGTSTAQGSGFVYDKSGHIVTNQHVVDAATTAQVRLSNGKTYSATVVGADTSTDLAVLKIDAPASQLHPVALADSSAVEVGDAVVAIGSPFGLEETITAGIVSALNRQIQATNGFTIGGAIQTDAAINHGNSGGPLIDMTGKVIGVNAQIESDSGDNAGVGFAIPSNTVKSVVAQILSSGAVEHAYLGVSIGDAASQGATVETVQAGTPAAKAGLQAGDVVTAVDGKSVANAAALTATVSGHKPGDKVTLSYTRNGSSQTVTVTLGTRPSSS